MKSNLSFLGSAKEDNKLSPTNLTISEESIYLYEGMGSDL